ncbi:NanoRNase/pAp phosphatase [Botrimarina colliarenosi]|uniref:NanoRNase/pAp phosphatase n=1 Tax=Botrimarina colliarenosi TaxID=2528001 RepID=A0A5C6AAF3_9BACT|nr:DHH family phosphoesterase [Botrimarina colliarenosi]TWT97004.1 NanoRNase/pAp phosphatase [Botrimarina colliarenosi]
MPIDWTPLRKLVAECDSFALTTHTRADCDAVGSELGLLYALEALGKRVRIINADAPPEHIRFLDPEGRVEVLGEGVSVSEVHQADAHIVCDTSAWGQLGAMADVIRTTPAQRCVIDHHQSGDDLDAIVLKDDTAEATGRLIVEATGALGVELSPKAASPLFAAIATDTGWFRFPSVTPTTYRTIAQLVEAGANPSDLFQKLYDRNTAARVRLHGRIMESLSLEIDGRVAFGQATDEDFDATGAAQADTEDVVNRLLSVEGVEVAVLIAAMEPGLTKCSLRSRSVVDVRPVAEKFGGGGHAKAAGVRYRGTIAETRTALLAAVKAQLQAQA